MGLGNGLVLGGWLKYYFKNNTCIRKLLCNTTDGTTYTLIKLIIAISVAL